MAVTDQPEGSRFLMSPGLLAVTTKPSEADPTREYVAGTTDFYAFSVPRILDITADRLTKWHGHRVYEAMMTDADVSSAICTLKNDVLSEGLLLAPAVSPEFDKEPSPDDRLSEEVCKFCERALKRLMRSPLAISYEWLDYLWRGVKLAEKVMEIPETGEDAGKLTLKAIKFKPSETWQFVVDANMNVLGIVTRDIQGTYTYLDRRHFAVGNWDQRDEDPRGRSILQAAWHPWNLKLQTWPIYWKGISQFGTPSIVGETAEDEPDRIPVDENGDEVVGADPVSPQAYMLSQLTRFQAGTAIAVANGAKVYPIESKQTGEAPKMFLELMKREITQAILLQVRATMEAQHGSRADSESAQDIKGSAVRYIRAHLAWLWHNEVLKDLVLKNYGPDVAERHTPTVSLGGTEHHDFAGAAKAVATLYGVNFLAPSQLRHYDALLGAPPRTADEIAAYQKAQAQNAMQGPGIDNGTPPPKKGANQSEGN